VFLDILHSWATQVKEDEAVIFHRDKVRRPVPEEKAIQRAVDMIRVRSPPAHVSVASFALE
jgi:hypothetical protein